MGAVRRVRWRWPTLVALSLFGFGSVPALAQFPGFGFSNQFELSNSVHLDEADAATKTHLERARAFLANQQWDEGIEVLRQVMENHGGKVVAVDSRRYISIREYCHLQLAEMPAAALALYRDRVDPQAEKWYADGLARHDPEPLVRVVEQMFCSSWGDDALMALGEFALEGGDYSGAREQWQHLLAPTSRPDGPPTWLSYPDASFDRAEILARLVLVSILEGSASRAKRELESYRTRYAAAEGRLAGREVNYAEALQQLLTDELPSWPEPAETIDWLTFGGSPERHKLAHDAIDLGGVAWRQPLPKVSALDSGTAPQRRVAEERGELLSYHPVVTGDLVIVGGQNEIRAYNIRNGQPAWGNDPVIYSDHDFAVDRARASSRSVLGAPRFTLTVSGTKLFARMGNPVTTSPNDQIIPTSSGYLICLDLAKQGMLVWRSAPLEEKWAFEGTPLVEGSDVYVGLRRGDVRPQAHVACFDIETGRQRWRRFIVSAETPAQGQMEEITHNLLTLAGGTLYYNTNLGCVAALAARDGQIRWITRYDREKSGDLNHRAAHFFRDLTPCLYDRGMLYVAPFDSRKVFALDASTGADAGTPSNDASRPRPWEAPYSEDAVHLLGVGGGNLLASGDKLWWINLAGEGKLLKIPQNPFPGGAQPKGLGRGVLVGDTVYWPARNREAGGDFIYTFNQSTGQQTRQPIDLKMRGVSGGNLVVARGHLLIASADELCAFSLAAPAAKPKPSKP